MKKLILFLGITLGCNVAYAQVGVGNQDPKSTLHVSGKPTDVAAVDGVIVPKLTGNELKAKDALYGADQVSALVYVTAAASPTTAKTANVTAPGYYYFDGSVWIKSNSGLQVGYKTIAGAYPTAASKGDIVFTTSDGTSAGTKYRIETYDGAAWVNDKGVYPYISTLAYAAADIVNKDNSLYESNGAIPANTVFSIGTTGATWKKVGSGSISILAKYTRTTQQTTGLSANGVVICDVAEFEPNSSDISVNTTTGQVTLAAGKTYRLRGTVPGYATSNSTSRPVFRWYNETSSQFVGQYTASTPSGDGMMATGAAGGTAEYLFTPSIATTLSFRIVQTTGLTGLGGITMDYPTSGSYPWIEIEQIGTTDVTGFTGQLGNAWNISNSYPSGTIVIRDGFLYQANANIGSGTAFAVGTTGATWTMLNVQAAEYGVQELATSVSLIANTASDILTFNIPSAGVWEVTWQSNAEGASGVNGNVISAWVTDISNNVMSNSSQRLHWALNSSLSCVGTNTFRITTTGAQQFKLRGFASGNAIFYASPGQSTAFRTNVIWKKISGFSPLQPRTFTEAVTIGATGTPPTKGTNRGRDYITLFDDNSGWCQVDMQYHQLNVTGALNGAGTYLFSLPAGYQFDVTTHRLNTQTGAMIGGGELVSILNGSNGIITRNDAYGTVVVVPHSASQFKLMVINGLGSLVLFSYVRSDYMQTSLGNDLAYGASFRFKKGN